MMRLPLRRIACCTCVNMYACRADGRQKDPPDLGSRVCRACRDQDLAPGTVSAQTAALNQKESRKKQRTFLQPSRQVTGSPESSLLQDGPRKLGFKLDTRGSSNPESEMMGIQSPACVGVDTGRFPPPPAQKFSGAGF
ncbi:hypothetical protein PGQ11_012009 [Apiospora arundinis]|uniref:Uncharacterized protein n=1 Tax=Apiospora arundinis TaxID=335852 RepID=A0ABR2I247_9PEZI